MPVLCLLAFCFYFNLKYLLILYVCIWGWRSEDKPQRLILSLYHVNSLDWTRVAIALRKYLYPLRHLVGSSACFLLFILSWTQVHGMVPLTFFLKHFYRHPGRHTQNHVCIVILNPGKLTKTINPHTP